jgi:hypothetical protein
MDNGRVVKKTFEIKPEVRGGMGKPILKWLEYF